MFMEHKNGPNIGCFRIASSDTNRGRTRFRACEEVQFCEPFLENSGDRGKMKVHVEGKRLNRLI